jgi:SPP1 family predicted phage head-tail adaptor
MSKNRGAGYLDQMVAFDKREEVDDGAGNTVGQWVEQFKSPAGYQHLRGGESVMADRLQGKHPQIITIRSNTNTRSITTDWRVRDARTDRAFNIRDITPTSDRAFLDLLVENGVADG